MLEGAYTRRMALTNLVTALRSGLATLDTYAAESVTYKRGSAEATLRAIRGDKSAIETDTGDETTTQTTRVDWIIRDTELDIDSGTIVPIESDLIIDGDGVKYRVTKHPTDGKPARWLEHRLAMRIHTLVVVGER